MSDQSSDRIAQHILQVIPGFCRKFQINAKSSSSHVADTVMMQQ